MKSDYLNIVKNTLKLDIVTKNDVVKELTTHIEDKAQDLKEHGCGDREAIEVATELLGSPQMIAKQIYEVYSQGSCKEALFAASPHFFIAIIFALQIWDNPLWLPALFLFITAVAIYGWFHEQPPWLFPWLGYCLVPVVIAGILLMYLPGSWAWIAFIPYAMLALWLLAVVAKQTVKKDWLLLSLTLLPVPIVVAWLLVLYLKYDIIKSELLYSTSPWISLSFIILSFTVFFFIRMRQRWVKAGTLLMPEILLLLLVIFTGEGVINFWGALAVICIALAVLFSPAVIERRIH